MGGILVGVWLKGWTFGETASAFTRLTVVMVTAAQVPAFLIATAAGMLIARGGDEGTISDRIPEQLAARPKAYLFISIFLGLLAILLCPGPFVGRCSGPWFCGMGGARRAAEAQRASKSRSGTRSAANDVTPERLAQISELQIDQGRLCWGWLARMDPS